MKSLLYHTSLILLGSQFASCLPRRVSPEPDGTLPARGPQTELLEPPRNDWSSYLVQSVTEVIVQGTETLTPRRPPPEEPPAYTLPSYDGPDFQEYTLASSSHSSSSTISASTTRYITLRPPFVPPHYTFAPPTTTASRPNHLPDRRPFKHTSHDSHQHGVNIPKRQAAPILAPPITTLVTSTRSHQITISTEMIISSQRHTSHGIASSAPAWSQAPAEAQHLWSIFTATEAPLQTTIIETADLSADDVVAESVRMVDEPTLRGAAYPAEPNTPLPWSELPEWIQNFRSTQTNTFTGQNPFMTLTWLAPPDPIITSEERLIPPLDDYGDPTDFPRSASTTTHSPFHMPLTYGTPISYTFPDESDYSSSTTNHQGNHHKPHPAAKNATFTTSATLQAPNFQKQRKTEHTSLEVPTDSPTLPAYGKPVRCLNP